MIATEREYPVLIARFPKRMAAATSQRFRICRAACRTAASTGRSIHGRRRA